MSKLPKIYYLLLFFCFALGGWSATFFNSKNPPESKENKSNEIAKAYRERTIEIKKQNELSKLYLRHECEMIPTKVCKEVK